MDVDGLSTDEYGKVWAGRIVEETDVCDEWAAENKLNID
jgi:hypothetical protein